MNECYNGIYTALIKMLQHLCQSELKGFTSYLLESASSTCTQPNRFDSMVFTLLVKHYI